MIKNPKKVKKIIQKALIGTLAGTSVFSIGSAIWGLNQLYDISDNFHNIREEIQSAEEYQEELHRKQDELYQQFKQGLISYSEYDSKMNLLMDNNLLEFDCLDTDKKDELTKIYDKQNNYGGHCLVSATTFFTTGIAAIGTGFFVSKQREDEMEI